MKLSILISVLCFIIIEVQLFFYYKYPIIKKKRKIKQTDVVNTLATKKMEDDLILEKDKDITLIDNYMKMIQDFLFNYNKSRSKKIAYRTRQTLLIETIKLIPVFSKYITLNYYYNLDDKEWAELTDRDMVLLLETAYNDFTHDNLDSINSVITAVLRLRDDKR